VSWHILETLPILRSFPKHTPPTFVIRHSSFVIRHSSFVIPPAPQQSRFPRKLYKCSFFLLIYFPNLIYCHSVHIPPERCPRYPIRPPTQARTEKSPSRNRPRSLDGLFSSPSPLGPQVMYSEPQIPTTHDGAKAATRGRPRTTTPLTGRKYRKKSINNGRPPTRTTPRKSRESMQSMKSMEQAN